MMLKTKTSKAIKALGLQNNNFSSSRIIILILVVLFTSCSEKKSRPVTSMDTARLFIESSLNGDFKTAENLLLKNQSNNDWYRTFEAFYNKLSPEQKEKYKNTNYQINSFNEVNDTLCLLNFSNDYRNKPMEMRLIKTSNEWFVDFSYSYQGDKIQ
jgi:hypothetical protein